MAKSETITSDDAHFLEVLDGIREGDRIELVTIHGDRLRTTIRRLFDRVSRFGLCTSEVRGGGSWIKSVRIIRRAPVAPESDPLEGAEGVIDRDGQPWARLAPGVYTNPGRAPTATARSPASGQMTWV